MKITRKLELFGLVGLVTLAGCVGYVGPGYGPDVAIGGPDVTIFGGGFERGHVVHDYARRGHESRGSAHFGHGGRR